MSPHSLLFKSCYVLCLPAWWALWLPWWPPAWPARCSNALMYVPIDIYHEILLLFYCCVLVEIKLNTTTIHTKVLCKSVKKSPLDKLHISCWPRLISYQGHSITCIQQVKHWLHHEVKIPWDPLVHYWPHNTSTGMDRRLCSGIILCMHPANERRHCIVTATLIDWAHTQNDPCVLTDFFHHWLHQRLSVMIRQQAIIWTNDAKLTDAYMRHSASMS